MQTLIDTTFTGKDISSAASVYEYTVVTAGTYRFQVRLAAVAGGGDYTIYLTLNDGDALTDDIIEPKSTITLAAGETKCWFVSSEIDLLAGDVVNIFVDGLAGDTSEAGSVRIFSDDSETDIWTYATRTLTSTASGAVNSVNGSDINCVSGDTLVASLTGLGDLVNWTNLLLIVKEDVQDIDTDAAIQISLTTDGLLDDLILFNGAVPANSSDGTLTIDDATAGDITIDLVFERTTELKVGIYDYEIQLTRSVAPFSSKLSVGHFVVT